MRDMEIKYRIF